MSGFNVLLHFLTAEQSVAQYRNILDKQIGIVSRFYIVCIERFHTKIKTKSNVVVWDLVVSKQTEF